MTPALEERRRRLLPDGKPRYVRVYDDKGEHDRYTVVFTGRYRHLTGGASWYLGVSRFGFGHYGEGDGRQCIDRPAHSHLGKRIRWEDLPPDAQRFALQAYEYLWGLREGELA